MFLPIDTALLGSDEARYKVAPKILPPGRFKGQNEPLHTVDFSDFLLMARDDLEDDIAELLAWCL